MKRILLSVLVAFSAFQYTYSAEQRRWPGKDMKDTYITPTNIDMGNDFFLTPSSQTWPVYVSSVTSTQLTTNNTWYDIDRKFMVISSTNNENTVFVASFSAITIARGAANYSVPIPTSSYGGIWEWSYSGKAPLYGYTSSGNGVSALYIRQYK